MIDTCKLVLSKFPDLQIVFSGSFALKYFWKIQVRREPGDIDVLVLHGDYSKYRYWLGKISRELGWMIDFHRPFIEEQVYPSFSGILVEPPINILCAKFSLLQNPGLDQSKKDTIREDLRYIFTNNEF